MRSIIYAITFLCLIAFVIETKAAKTEAPSYPPWQNEYAPSPVKGARFTVPCVDNMPDFHGDPVQARFVVFAGGNYFFALDELVQAFEQMHPALKGKIFYETLPPGIVARQVEMGAITVGNLSLTIKADVVQAGKSQIKEMVEKGLLEGPGTVFTRNRLAIMVPKDNKAGIHSIRDLGRAGVRIANPNPETEGIAKQIKEALRKAGGDQLAQEAYERKIRKGEAIITDIHHRQTPLWILEGKIDAGVTWISEVKYQERIGHPITAVEIPEQENAQGEEAAAIVKGAKNRETAEAWLLFLHSSTARSIFEKYGMEASTGQATGR